MGRDEAEEVRAEKHGEDADKDVSGAVEDPDFVEPSSVAKMSGVRRD